MPFFPLVEYEEEWTVTTSQSLERELKIIPWKSDEGVASRIVCSTLDKLIISCGVDFNFETDDEKNQITRKHNHYN